MPETGYVEFNNLVLNLCSTLSDHPYFVYTTTLSSCSDANWIQIGGCGEIGLKFTFFPPDFSRLYFDAESFEPLLDHPILVHYESTGGIFGGIGCMNAH